MTDSPIILYCGHHKCATRWLVDIIGEACGRLKLHFFEAHNGAMVEQDISRFADKQSINFLAYTNARFDLVRKVEHKLGFHVVRDPRDLLVSAYFSHLNSHPVSGWPALEKHKQRLRDLSTEEGLLLELEFSKNVFDALAAWQYDDEAMLEVQMEALTSNPYETLVDIFHHLGLIETDEIALDDEIARIIQRQTRLQQGPTLARSERRLQRCEMLQITYDHRFSKKAGGRKIGQEDSHSHYRRGQAGDWRNHFTPAVTTHFKQMFGGILDHLGYDPGKGW